jgi:ribonuclease T2
LLLVLVISGAGVAAKRKPRASSGKFDYFLLALSWAPEYCATSGGAKDVRECGTGRKVGFVVHGLWPEANAGRGPESCGTASPVGQSIVQAMLDYIPSASLIQHEWKTHGTCSGLSQADFFAAVRKTRDRS